MVAIPDFVPDIEIQRAFYEYDIAAPLNSELTKPWEEVIKVIKSKLYQVFFSISYIDRLFQISGVARRSIKGWGRRRIFTRKK